MKSLRSKLFILLLAGLFVLSSLPVSAASKVQVFSPLIEDGKTGTVTLSYTDDTDGNAPVSGAQFTLYKIGNLTQGTLDSDGNITGGEETSSQNTSTESGLSPSIASGYMPLIDGITITEDTDPVDIQKTVQNAYKQKVDDGKTYTLTTNEKGEATVSNVDLGLYLAVETKAAEGHYESIPFFVTIPEMVYSDTGSKQGWSYNIKAYPKALPAGDLIVEKQLSGNATEKDFEWHFKIDFDTKTAKSASGDYTNKIVFGEAPNGYHTAYGEGQTPDSSKDSVVSSTISGSVPDSASSTTSSTTSSTAGDPSSEYGRDYSRISSEYDYTTTDGRKGSIKSGDTITLKGGQSATITRIPIGTSYKVTEVEANKNNYKTTVQNDQNTITQKHAQKVTFINVRSRGEKKVVTITKGQGGNGASGANGGLGRRIRSAVQSGDVMFRTAMVCLVILICGTIVLVAVKKHRNKGKGGDTQ